MMGPWILFQLINKATIAIYNGVSTTLGMLLWSVLYCIVLYGCVCVSPPL